MDCHSPGRRVSARCASALLAAGMLLAPAATDRLGEPRERSAPLAGIAYSAPISAPPPQAGKTPQGTTRSKSRKSRLRAKHRKARTAARHGWKPRHLKPAHAKPPRVKKPAPAQISAHPVYVAPVSNPKAAKAVREALSLLGTPYLWGGTTRAGFDCSGLTQHVWAAAGVKIPRTVRQQADAGTPIPLNQAQPGDLVVFYPSRHHVGIYIGGGLVVDSPHTGSWVRTDPIRSMPVSVVVRPVGEA